VCSSDLAKSFPSPVALMEAEMKAPGHRGEAQSVRRAIPLAHRLEQGTVFLFLFRSAASARLRSVMSVNVRATPLMVAAAERHD